MAVAYANGVVTTTGLRLALPVAGLALTAAGAYLLWKYAPVDTGGVGRLYYAGAKEGVERRRRRSRQGFMLILVGSLLQLAGPVIGYCLA